jgi:CBS domain-containing protein
MRSAVKNGLRPRRNQETTGGAREAERALDAAGCRQKCYSFGAPGTRSEIARAGIGRPEGGAAMTTARDIMSSGADCAQSTDTLIDAAKRMRDLDVGALPVCGEDARLAGMITDRDIVVRALAEGRDPGSTKVGDLADGKPVTIGADDSVEEALATMSKHGVRRLPVIDGHDLVGVVSQADVARHLPDDKVGDLVEAISSAPSNS